jgi:hypothetical protein
MLANRISTDLSLSAQGLRGRYTIDALRNPNWPAALEPLTVAGTFHRDTRGLGVAGHARSGDSVLARWRVDQAARSAYPSVDIMVDAPAPALWEPVKVVLGSAWAAVNVRSGHVRGRVLRDGDGDGDTAPQGIGDVIAERITGNYDEMRFAGAEISVHLADALRPVMDYRINIATITLANGVIVEDFHSRGHQDAHAGRRHSTADYHTGCQPTTPRGRFADRRRRTESVVALVGARRPGWERCTERHDSPQILPRPSGGGKRHAPQYHRGHLAI